MFLRPEQMNPAVAWVLPWVRAPEQSFCLWLCVSVSEGLCGAWMPADGSQANLSIRLSINIRG